MAFSDLLVRVPVMLAGVALMLLALGSAVRSFVLPRNEAVFISTLVFRLMRAGFSVAAALARTYARRDWVLAFYAPVSLITLPIVWLGLLSAGYTCMFWAVGEGSWLHCYRLSNNSLLTLGAEKPVLTVTAVLSYSEATLGLLLITLLISYLPTIYQAFSKRELVVSRLELRAGAPSSAVNLVLWLNHSGSLRDDESQWARWEEWFVGIEESHTSLPIISFFRSPQPGRSWVITAGIILDTAALIFSCVDQPRSRAMELCFKAGCIAMNRVYRFFETRAHSTPSELITTGDPLEEPTRQAFEHAFDQLAENGVQMVANRAEAWRQYRELRSRYEDGVVFLAKLVVAPEVKTVR